MIRTSNAQARRALATCRRTFGVNKAWGIAGETQNATSKYDGYFQTWANTTHQQLVRNSTANFISRTLSTTAGAGSSAGDKKEEGKDKKEETKTVWDPFLDNIGKIFLAVIGMIIAALVRSSKGSQNRIKVRENIEELSTSILDPLEIDDLRIANDELTVDVFERMMKRVYNAGKPSMSYAQFISMVKDEMQNEGKGPEFTIQLGHLLDRVVLAATQVEGGAGASLRLPIERDEDEEVLLPVSFLLAAYSLALNAGTDDRLHLLFQVMKEEEDSTRKSGSDSSLSSSFDSFATSDAIVDAGNSNVAARGGNDRESVLEDTVVRMISHLQNTCQLPPETQSIDIRDEKYPIQQYKRATARELMQRSREAAVKDKVHIGETFSFDEFQALLCSPTICAWGECYSKKRK
mmetsp:Transcript_2926/g.4621  ORF Transcript_2926/g.4621 Transcript_2926/m.4621 type:complete len:406 (-) Transcript_2926:376-1593(-)